MKFLGGCDIHCGDFESIFGLATENDFIFIDPPYIDRLGYTDGDGGNDLHHRLVQCMHNTKAKWMFIHSDNDYYKNELKQYNIILKPFAYGQRFGKGKNHANAAVKHMYVTNYKNSMTDHLVAVPGLQSLLEAV
jgi:DNA adenine methylase